MRKLVAENSGGTCVRIYEGTGRAHLLKGGLDDAAATAAAAFSRRNFGARPPEPCRLGELTPSEPPAEVPPAEFPPAEAPPAEVSILVVTEVADASEPPPLLLLLLPLGDGTAPMSASAFPRSKPLGVPEPDIANGVLAPVLPVEAEAAEGEIKSGAVSVLTESFDGGAAAPAAAVGMPARAASMLRGLPIWAAEVGLRGGAFAGAGAEDAGAGEAASPARCFCSAAAMTSASIALNASCGESFAANGDG